MNTNSMPAAQLSTRQLFDQIYKTHANNLYRFLYFLFGNKEEAEDILQEAFIKLYHSFLDGQQILNIKAWLYRVASNLSTNVLKRHSHLQKILSHHSDEVMGNLTACPDDAEQQLMRHQEIKIMQQGIGALRPRDRVVLALYLNGMGYDDIAKTIKVRKSTIRTILFRAISRLNKQIKHGG
jgi:RNA polymerase sigma factor (sigma-70 family)